MSLEVEATYENGVLKPSQALPLQEGQKVNLTIKPVGSAAKRLGAGLKWTGSKEDLEHLAESDENHIWTAEE
jgi:predicted DNA-binding antitoxin AbrB/MazE fold protein